MRKFLVLILVGLTHFAVFAAEKKAEDRAPASQSCIKAPTIECMPNYEVRQIGGCFRCVHSAVGEVGNDVIKVHGKTCIKAPTLTCKTGYSTIQDAEGCFHCAPRVITEPSCVKSPTLECIHGYHTSVDTNSCFHCVKD